MDAATNVLPFETQAPTLMTVPSCIDHQRIYRVVPRLLNTESGYNVRIDYGDIPGLARSIKNNGMRRPVEVRLINGQLVVEDGHRRMAAVLYLLTRQEPITFVPITILPTTYNPTDRIFSLLVSNDGKPLTPIEEAQAYNRLVDAGLKAEDIAKKVGKSLSTVTDRLLLLRADPELLAMIEKKQIGVTVATEAIKTSDGDHAFQRKIAELSKTDKTAAKKLAITDKNGKFYVTKRNRAHLDEALAKARQAKADGDDETLMLHIGIIEGIRLVLDIDDQSLKNLGVDLSSLL